MSEWQTIDTAPKDGTQILLYGLGVPGFPIAWDTDTAREPTMLVSRWFELWYDKDEDAGGGLFRKVKALSVSYWKHEGSPHQFAPTHWMPLPQPPAIAAKNTRAA